MSIEEKILIRDSKPRLLVATSTFPRWAMDAGPAPFVFELARSLQKYFEVTVLAPHFPGAELHEIWDGMEVVRFRYLPDKYETLADGQGMQNHLRNDKSAGFKAVPFLVGEYLAGRKLLRARKFDFINSHWLVPSGMVFSELARRFRVPHVVTVHAADFFMLNRSGWGKSLMRRIAASAKAVMPVNQLMAEGVKKVCPGAKTYVMPMGFDPGLFRSVDPAAVENLRRELSLQGKKLILYLGKLAEKKGVDNLLKAVKILSKDVPNFQVLVVGKGGHKPHVERQASKLEVSYWVRFAGGVPHKAVPLYYAMADVVAVPSRPDKYGETEGMPVVVLEALASRKPVVGTVHCHVPEALKRGGFIEVPDAGEQELAKGLKKALEGDFQADFSLVDEYSWDRVARLYSEVIAG